MKTIFILAFVVCIYLYYGTRPNTSSIPVALIEGTDKSNLFSINLFKVAWMKNIQGHLIAPARHSDSNIENNIDMTVFKDELYSFCESDPHSDTLDTPDICSVYLRKLLLSN